MQKKKEGPQAYAKRGADLLKGTHKSDERKREGVCTWSGLLGTLLGLDPRKVYVI